MNDAPAARRDPAGDARAAAEQWRQAVASSGGGPRAGPQPGEAASPGGTDAASLPSDVIADPGVIRLCHACAILAAIVAIGLGTAALIGWLAAIPILTSFRADWVAMKANTAVGLVAAGGALILSVSGHAVLLSASRLCAAFVTTLGIATLVEYASGWDPGFDQALLAEPSGAIATTNPGRMAAVAAGNFALCGLALIFLGSRTARGALIASLLALPCTLASAIAVLVYGLGAEEPPFVYGAHATSIAAPTAAAFVFLGGGIGLAGVGMGAPPWLASPYSGGFMLRRLLPLAVLGPMATVWLRIIGQRMGWFTTIEFGAATVSVTMIAIMSGALVWCAKLLDGLERVRLGREAQIGELNAALRNRLHALEVANKELEGFSYATSHVLRAPLRAIDGFSNILLQDYGEKLDSEGRRLLGVVRESNQEMAEAIDGILEFLRLGQSGLSLATIGMNEAVRLALEELEPKTRGRKLKILLSPLPDVVADKAMIHRVWTTLLDNAIKFTTPKVEATIEIGAIPDRAETVFYVRDDGVGFDMAYAAKLFGVFNRLHGSEFAGNGMGLAIVQRIVARHGGSVWAEGKPNEGATFYFTLPTKETGHA